MTTPSMPDRLRICFIGKYIMSRLAARMLQHHFPRTALQTTFREKEEIDSDRIIDDLLQQEYDVISLPLSLENYGTLYLLEMANAVCLPTRVFLISNTEADPAPLKQVFDYFSCLYQVEECARFTAPSTRERRPEKVDEAFDRILQTAHCFRVPAGPGLPSRFSTLEDYRRRRQPKPGDPFARP